MTANATTMPCISRLSDPIRFKYNGGRQIIKIKSNTKRMNMFPHTLISVGSPIFAIRFKYNSGRLIFKIKSNTKRMNMFPHKLISVGSPIFESEDIGHPAPRS